jgi:hypothetical protein
MDFTEEVKKDARIIAKDIKGNDNYLTSSIVLAGVATFLVIGVLIYQYFSTSSLLKRAFNYLKLQEQISTTMPVPTPTSIPLPRGLREFGVSGGDNPQIGLLKLSEYSPKIGEDQTITISVTDDSGGKVTSVAITMMTDNETKTYQLKLSSGSAKKGDWSTTIMAEDTRNYTYGMDIRARNDKGQASLVQPRFR